MTNEDIQAAMQAAHTDAAEHGQIGGANGIVSQSQVAEFSYDVAQQIPVTSEMRAAGARLYDSAKDDFERSDLDAIYRVMAAVAPKPSNWLLNVVPMTQYMELEAENAALKAALDLVRAESVKDLFWLGSEWDRVCSAKDDKIAELTTNLTTMSCRAHEGQASFGDSTPADLSDPPRRPDGTLQPQAKPLPSGALTQQVGGKRVGG